MSGPIASDDAQCKWFVSSHLWLEYKYCKIPKASNKLWLDTLLMQETHVNGLVDWQVREVELGARRYGYIFFQLHAKTYAKAGLMILLKDNIRVDAAIMCH